jgi:hypothetical protein
MKNYFPFLGLDSFLGLLFCGTGGRGGEGGG